MKRLKISLHVSDDSSVIVVFEQPFEQGRVIGWNPLVAQVPLYGRRYIDL